MLVLGNASATLSAVVSIIAQVGRDDEYRRKKSLVKSMASWVKGSILFWSAELFVLRRRTSLTIQAFAKVLPSVHSAVIAMGMWVRV